MVVAAQPTQQVGEEDLRKGQHRVHVEVSPRRVRVKFNGEIIADSKRAVLLRESNLLPVYYFPPEDVRQDVLTPTDLHTRCPYKGEASYWTVTVGDKRAENAMWGYVDPLPGREDIAGYRAFYWAKMDAWYEEDEEIFKHPRDPYHRVDVVQSSRHVKVEMNGQVVADSTRPRLLFETGLPTRYYLPQEDVRMDLLEPTDTSSVCPYKGTASYWKLRGDTSGRDVAWAYLDPISEIPKIRGLISFFNERVDGLFVDDEKQDKPKTAWS
ncbi:MAG TPA: DUF427 domain-containing protein [Chloroflexota bacterium]|jgi:uncharacterized protein (DUF427 family)|nr:DUF427 domain-containing protein [Chloroflexota bacterium]